MDPFTLVALTLGIISTIGSAIGAGVNANITAQGQKAANEANKELFLQELAFNSAEAQKNRDFQLMMSSTAHQREVADMKAAGLNPWLSVSGAGSVVNSTSSASSSGTPKMNNSAPDLSQLASVLSSAKDLALITALSSRYGGNNSSSGSRFSGRIY